MMIPFNKAELSKQTWYVVQQEDCLSVKVLVSKSARGDEDLVVYQFTQRDSGLWRRIHKLKDVIKRGMGKNVFNDQSTLFSHDKWLGNFTL